MPEFTTKDFYSYTPDATQNKDMILLVAKPAGGSAFTLVNMTKEEFFAITGHSIAFTTSVGPSTIINLNTGQAEFIYINPGIFLFKGLTLGLSTNGTSNVVQLNSNGSIQAGDNSVNGAYILANNTFDLTVTRTLTANLADEWSLMGDQKLDYRIPLTGGTTVLSNTYDLTSILDSSLASIATHTIELPSSPRDNQIAKVTIYGVITAITMTSGGTIEQPLTASTGTITTGEWQYRLFDTTWYKTNTAVASTGGQVNTVSGVTNEIVVTGTAVDPIVGLATAAKASLTLADSALQVVKYDDQPVTATGATVVDLSLGNNPVLNVTANATISVSNVVSGNVYVFTFFSASSFTAVFNNASFFDSLGTPGDVTPSGVANTATIVSFIAIGTNLTLISRNDA